MNTTKRGIATRRRILEAAAALIYRTGVNGTSVDDILKASGTGKSQFYHYFASKDALVDAVIVHHLGHHDGLKALAVGPLRGLDDFHAWLDRVVDAAKNGAFVSGCPFGNLAAEVSLQSESVRTTLASAFTRWENELAAMFRGLKVNGVMRADADPIGLALLCIASIEGAILLGKNSASTATIEAVATTLVELVRMKCVDANSRMTQTMAAPAPAQPRTVEGATAVPPKSNAPSRIPAINAARTPKNLGFCP